MDKPPVVPTERNAPVHAEHRRETQRQIYLPIIIGVLVILAGVIAIIIYGLRAESTLRRWADVSLIWVIIPVMFIGVIFMIVTIGVLFGVTRVLGILPGYGNQAQGYVRQAASNVNRFADGMIEPVLRARSSWAVIKRRDRLLHKKSTNIDGSK